MSLLQVSGAFRDDLLDFILCSFDTLRYFGLLVVVAFPCDAVRLWNGMCVSGQLKLASAEPPGRGEKVTREHMVRR